MRLVLISDTHNQHLALPPLPPGDVIVHAGDITGSGTLEEIRRFFDWFGALPYRHKIVIAGNHDFGFERQAQEAEGLVPAGVTYLRDQETRIGPFKLWGAPWQPWFGNLAFNRRRGPAIAERWALIPDDVNILITHGPPHGILDETSDHPPARVGCEALADRLSALPMLKLHVFGHIHESYGQNTLRGCRFVNASACDERYKLRNPPVVVDMD